MINKRLLIKNLLVYNDENSFYDKKLQLNIANKEGKAKFLKHVCALSNSNPDNNSYIVIGVEDESNKIVGVDFFDDSKIQNLINAYLLNPPKIQYENVAFPHLSRHKVVGLVTINPIKEITTLKKSIWKYLKNTTFFRRGSNSLPTDNLTPKSSNKSIVSSIEKNAANNIEHTLNGVFDFMNDHKELNPTYKVFKDQFVLCWAGVQKKIAQKVYYSRVDIALVNEQVRLFYSTLDEVQIKFNKQSFIITEFIQLGIQQDFTYYPLEKTVIHFKNNGTHDIAHELLFEPPPFDLIVLKHTYNSNNALINKIKKGVKLSKNELIDLENVPITYLICSLNGFKDAKKKMIDAKPFLRALTNKSPYIKLKEAERILRKIKYN
tara:strand:+ start:265416 stop:266549 length:1134 start_codon:yes stop_codon:yes gene_type:complete